MYTDTKNTSVKYYSEYTDKNGKRHYTVSVFKYCDNIVERMRDYVFEKVKHNVNFG